MYKIILIDTNKGREEIIVKDINRVKIESSFVDDAVDIVLYIIKEDGEEQVLNLTRKKLIIEKI